MTDREPGQAIPHLPALDGLRGVAILLVVTLHFGVRAGFPGPARHPAGIAIERLCYLGWTGVDLFFVLSGFLITSILLASRARPRYFANFYGRRTLRIFPLYFGVLALGLLILPALVPAVIPFLGESPAHPVWLWTYTSNLALAFAVVQSFGAFDLFWTLAIEEQFYAVWPLVVRLCRPRALVAIAVALILAGPVVRALWTEYGTGWGGAYRFTLGRFDQLALGALVAILPADDRLLRWSRGALLVSAVALVAMVALYDPFYPAYPVITVLGHSVVGVLYASLIAQLAHPALPRLAAFLGRPLLRAWGQVSYGAYVWHWPLWMALDRLYRRVPPAETASGQILQAFVFLLVGWLGSFGLGWLSYHLFEARFLRLKRRFAYRA